MEERSNQRGKKERKGEEVKENGKSVKEQKRSLVLQGTKATCILYKGSGNETGGLGMRLEVWE